MKSFRTWWPVLPASALALSACDSKKETPAPAAPSPTPSAAVAPAAGAPAPAPAVTALSAAERAAMLGIVGRLSKDTESVLGIYDGKEIVKRLRGLKTWDFIRQTAIEEGGTDPEEEVAEDMAEAGKFIGQEMFIATGKGSAPQLANLMNVSRRVNYYQFRMLTQSFAEGVKNGEFNPGGGPTADIMSALAKDIGKELDLIDRIAIPPVLAGIKAVDKESLDMALQGISSNLDMMGNQLGEGAKALEFTKGGVSFKGYKLLGSFLATQMEQNRADMEQMLAPADVDKLIASIKKKNLVMAYGALDNYLMVYLGDSEEGVPLVDKVEDSLAASDAVSYVDGFKGKKVVGFVYADKEVGKASIQGSLKDIALGVRDGLSGTTAFGDTRDLAQLLDVLGEKEDSLMGLCKAESGGMVAVLDQGVKFEFFGGVDRGAFDLSTKHKLSKLGGGEGVLLFGNWINSPEYTKRANEYGEALIETAYSMAEKVAGLKLEDSDLQQFQQGFGLFNEKFRTDTIGIWDSLQTMHTGLGQEHAFIVDLKGSVPPIPSVPQELVDGGKFFRASSISPVTDRAKLKESWTKLEGSLKNILKTASEMAGEDIPMQKPIPTEKNGLTTWFFSFPFFTPDFMPNVTLSDKWFVVSTSQVQAQELAAAADSAGDDTTGARFELDFDTLRSFTTDWVALLEKNGEGVMGPGFEEFKTQLPRIRKGLEAFGEFDNMGINQRVEGSTLRTTIHFKVR